MDSGNKEVKKKTENKELSLDTNYELSSEIEGIHGFPKGPKCQH
jgi:hypothetical protein